MNVGSRYGFFYTHCYPLESEVNLETTILTVLTVMLKKKILESGSTI